MKRNEEFLLRSVADTLVLVPIGNAVSSFGGMVTLNATGAFLWETLESEQTAETLTKALTDRYDVAEEKARQDVDAFIAALLPIGAIL
jgi:hypothetical protein